MDEKQKEILFDMMYKKLLNSVVLPRGYAKSPLWIFINCYEEAIKRTNYILEAIGEKLDSRNLQRLL